ncbi:cubilin-like [Lineus longissimus]|uniref:cubilin-like n=1 Tax=Lineus longissimus TaxID=88925 RepID=UPI00315CA4A4
MLNFVSDAEGSGTGFTALFTCKLKYPKACDPNVTEPEVINITSATIITDVRSFNPIEGKYMKNAMCRWKVCWDPRKFKVEYKTVGDFDIKTNNSCQQDRLVISNETDSSNVSACTTSAIDTTQVQVEANSTEACLSVNFTANGDAEVGGGFQVLITSAYDVPLHCDSGKAGKQPPVAVANTEPIYLSTWGYEHGFNYLANQTCIWPQFTWDQQRCTLGYETVGVMSIYQTVNDTTCETDYIEVTTGAGNTTKYCGGDAIPLTNVTDSNSLSVKFVTDSATNTTGKGCKIKVQCQKRELSKGCFYPDEDEDVAEYELTEPSNGISLTSVDRPKNLKYIPGYKCSWKVKYDNEKLDLLVSTKGKFDLKTGADCTKDTLTIKEGANGTDECVKGPISTRRLVKENETEVNHTSNNDNEVGEGFELVFLPVPKGCGGKPVKKELQTDENLSFYGQIENRTVNYAPDLNCNWEYEWDKDLFDVSYKIENVNIKGTPAKTCDKGDKLVLDDGKVTNNVCGTANVTLTPVQTGKLKIQFTSDPDAQTGSGFNLILVVTFKACVAGAKTPIKLDKPDKHEIDFYGEGYPESLSCEWNYQWDTAIYDVQFCFPKIEVTGSMPACAQDKIDTMDGQTKKALCGAAAVSCITADSGNLTIGFISDAIKAADGKGFEMVIKVSYQACTNAKKEIVTELTKPGTHVLKFYNPEKYHKDLNCTYTFKWNLQSLTVKQKLLNMDIDASTKNCSNASTDDYLERSDGKNAIRVCGNATDLLKKPLELKTGFASYNFISNADGNNGRGFIVEFEITKRVLPKACRDGDSMTIKLPGNTTLESLDRDQNLPYLSDLNCSTTLKHDPKRLRLSLTTVGAVDINSPNAKCENDSLVIQDGEKGNTTKHCQNTKIETPIELESGHTVISFHSDGANEGKGYSVVVAAELPEECDGGTTIEITNMTPPTLISSWAPADAENYIGGLHCTWTVTWNKQKFDMKVKSLVMDIEQSAGCANDYLETHAGGAAAVKTCGNSAIAETTIDSKVDNYTVSFVSDGDQNSKTTGMGFKLQFTPTLRKLPEGCSWGKECTNPKKITIPDVNKNYTITSPDRADGLDYSPGLCCQYEFSWASDKMDVVYGFLGFFETEGNGTDCERDYVAVTDGASEKVETCGMKQYPASLTNRSQQQAKSNKLVLKFKSDNNNTSVFKGFEAMVKSVDLEGM